MRFYERVFLLPRDSGEGGPRVCAVEGARAVTRHRWFKEMAAMTFSIALRRQQNFESRSAFNPRHPGQENIHQDDVGRLLRDEAEGLLPAGAGASAGEVGKGIEQPGPTLADLRLVLDQGDFEGCLAG